MSTRADEAAEWGVDREYDLETPTEYAGIYLERRRACGFVLYNAVGVECGDEGAPLRCGWPIRLPRRRSWTR